MSTESKRHAGEVDGSNESGQNRAMKAKRSSEEPVLRQGECGKREPVGVWHGEGNGPDRVCG
jgi:hypothetical protein